uniref:Uncharacterized protein n=1 Tax=Siphoviridae sp. ctlHU7 TaxID=2827588 RepID=A0A8S5LID0_9CAUD|nr:MAG TPA: hypothetical protein [Siphoviridae sp. ctlHU7]DAG13861.1 MAG TPA: hypothetical protein [Caudoviricetes sp.]DAI63391.1 MAG TPA: hypothetical protein [Caudoviricetes sp.]DAI79108.1 MAG TPA: hypothetical protein [Caudoviricetes sp.]DAJ10222.1 MAG TPA: hypothetical protein [Caudoviricetes sp.]
MRGAESNNRPSPSQSEKLPLLHPAIVPQRYYHNQR